MKKKVFNNDTVLFFLKIFAFIFVVSLIFNAPYYGKNTVTHWDNDKYMIDGVNVWSIDWNKAIKESEAVMLNLENYGVDFENPASIPKAYTSSKELMKHFNTFHLMTHQGTLYFNYVLLGIAQLFSKSHVLSYGVYQVLLMILYALSLTLLLNVYLSKKKYGSSLIKDKKYSSVLFVAIITSPMFISTSRQGMSELFALFFTAMTIFLGVIALNNTDNKKKSYISIILSAVCFMCIVLNRFEYVFIPFFVLIELAIIKYEEKKNLDDIVKIVVVFITSFIVLFIIHGLNHRWFFLPHRFYELAYYPAKIFWSPPFYAGAVYTLVVGLVPFFIFIPFLFNKALYLKMRSLWIENKLIFLLNTFFVVVTIGLGFLFGTNSNADMRAKLPAFIALMYIVLPLIELKKSKIQKITTLVLSIIVIFLNLNSAYISQRLYVYEDVAALSLPHGKSFSELSINKLDESKITMKSYRLRNLVRNLTDGYIMKEDRMRYYDSLSLIDIIEKSESENPKVLLTTASERHIFNAERIAPLFSDIKVEYLSDEETLLTQIERYKQNEFDVYIGSKNKNEIGTIVHHYAVSQLKVDSKYLLYVIDGYQTDNISNELYGLGIVDQIKTAGPVLDGDEIHINGFVLTDRDIEHVIIKRFDNIIGIADYPLYRPDVAKAFPQYKMSAESGFRFSYKLNSNESYDNDLFIIECVYSDGSSMSTQQLEIKSN